MNTEQQQISDLKPASDQVNVDKQLLDRLLRLRANHYRASDAYRQRRRANDDLRKLDNKKSSECHKLRWKTDPEYRDRQRAYQKAWRQKKKNDMINSCVSDKCINKSDASDLSDDSESKT